MVEGGIDIYLVKNVIIFVDTTGLITCINSHAEKFFGCETGEVIGKHLIGTLIPADGFDGKDLTKLINNLVNLPAQSLKVRYEAMRKGGSRELLEWTNTAIMAEDGSVTGIMTIGEHI